MSDLGVGQKDFNGGQTDAKLGLTGLTHAEGRARGQERFLRREARLRAELPKSAVRVFDSAPSRYRPLLAKVLCGEATMGQAVRAQCQQCVGWEDTSARVKDCASRGCPIWHFRPYRDGETESHTEQGGFDA